MVRTEGDAATARTTVANASAPRSPGSGAWTSGLGRLFLTLPVGLNEIPLVAPEPIPALRHDLEVERRPNGIVDVRDPHLLQIYTLDADDYALAESFDGHSDVYALHAKLGAKKRAVSRSEITRVAREFDELRLLDTPEAWKEKPSVDNVAPYSQIDTRRKLKILPTADEGARWACHACGACCHGLAVELSREEEARIDARRYQDILHGEDFAESSFLNADEPAKRVLRQREDDDNACIFLAPNGQCLVHARQGMEAKPDACQMFPAMVMVVPGGSPRLGLRTNCGSMWKSFEDGPPVASLAGHTLRVLSESDFHKAPKTVKLFRRRVPIQKLDRICQDVRTTFDRAGIHIDTIFDLDARHLGGRVRASQGRYGKHVLGYLEKEASGPAPVEEGAYRNQVARLARGRDALRAMKEGRRPPRVSPRVEAFLKKQIGHVMYLLGPLNLPDAGYGLVGMMLGLTSALFAIGPRGTLKTANAAFEVFMGPLLETMEHSWPILDAIDAEYADRLRTEV